MNTAPLDTFALQGDWTRLDSAFSVRFEFSSGNLWARWSPQPPVSRAEFSATVEQAYRQARSLFIAELAECLGVDVICVEIGGALS